MVDKSKSIRLIESAGLLFHRNGLSATSLAHIAKHANIPIGNMYYYFKTKEDLSLAVIEKQSELYKAAYKLLDDNLDDPRLRLIEAVKTFNNKKDEYARYGCPIAKIIDDSDVAKDKTAKAAALILAGFADWAGKQFEALGYKGEEEKFGTCFVSSIQGSIIMAKALQNPKVISHEIMHLIKWIENLPNKKIPMGKTGIKS